MKCPQCGEEFEPNAYNQRYCSAKCKNRVRYALLNTARHVGYELNVKVCPICGKEFMPHRTDQKYCSQKCCKRAAYLRGLAGETQHRDGDLPKRACVVCGKEFVPRAPHQKFCSRECYKHHDVQRSLEARKRGMEIMATYSEINEKKGRYAERIVEKYLKGQCTILQSQPQPYPSGGARVDYLCAKGDDTFYVEVKYRRLYAGKYFSLCEWLVDAYRSFAAQKGLPVWIYIVDVETGAIYAQELKKLLTPTQIADEEFPKKTTQQLPDGDKPFLVWHISRFNLVAKIDAEDLKWHAQNIENSMEESTESSEMNIKKLITSLQNSQTETKVEESTNFQISEPEVQSEVKVEEVITPPKS